MRNILPFFLYFICSHLVSQTVVRGPYLQSNTDESICVKWRTNTSTDTKVWYGTDTLNLSQVVYINESVTEHRAQLTGLQPYTRYYYKVGTSASSLVGGTGKFSFKTHPVPGSSVKTRIWATGDFGRGSQAQIDAKVSYLNYTGARGTDVWLWLGDNAYDDGTDAEYQSKVFNVNGFSDVFNYTPFYPTPGNHDYNSIWPGGLFVPYSTGLALSNHTGPYYSIVEVPKYGEAGGFPSGHEVYYSFNYGDVHFLSLNSELYAALSSTEMNTMKTWIINDLQQNTSKFTIAYFHQCPHTKGSHDSDDIYELAMKAMREEIMPLLEARDVDLIISGHSHVFERSYLIKGFYQTTSGWNASTMLMDGTSGNLPAGTPYMKDGSKTTAEGSVYVVCGNSGSSESNPDLNHPIMYYSHGGSSACGSFVIDVNKNRLDGKYLKSNGQVADEFTILKKDLVLASGTTYTVCAGDSLQLTASFSGGSDHIKYLWSKPGAPHTQSIYVSPTSTTMYTLSVTDSLTGQVQTTGISVSVLPFARPSIIETLPGALDATSNGSGYTYQWYINGVVITGGINRYYQAVLTGTYTVKVTSPNGCSSVSDGFPFNSTVGMDEQNQYNEAQIFPNPVETQFTLQIPNAFAGETYEILDINGKLITKGQIAGEKTLVKVEGYAPGTYVVVFLQNGEKRKTAFIKK